MQPAPMGRILTKTWGCLIQEQLRFGHNFFLPAFCCSEDPHDLKHLLHYGATLLSGFVTRNGPGWPGLPQDHGLTHLGCVAQGCFQLELKSLQAASASILPVFSIGG